MSTTDQTSDPTVFGTSSTWWPQKNSWVPLIMGGSEDSDSDEGGDDTPDDTGDGTDTVTSGGRTFTQEEVNSILAREVSKKTRGKVDPKELGFDSMKELNEFVDAAKQKADADKTEAQRQLDEAVKKAREEERAEVLPKAHRILLKAEFKLLAREAGIPKERLEDAFVLAQQLEDWADVKIENDEVVGLDEGFFDTLKETKKFLFAEENEGEGEEGTRDIGARAGGGSAAATNKELAKLFPALQNIGNQT